MRGAKRNWERPEVLSCCEAVSASCLAFLVTLDALLIADYTKLAGLSLGRANKNQSRHVRFYLPLLKLAHSVHSSCAYGGCVLRYPQQHPKPSSHQCQDPPSLAWHFGVGACRQATPGSLQRAMPQDCFLQAVLARSSL